MPAGWPALPADLYFLRDGHLWRWPAAGGELQHIAGDSLVAYRGTPDGRRVVYLTAEGRYYLLDEGGPGPQLLPTTGRPLVYYTTRGNILNPDLNDLLRLDQFALAPDGRYLVYIAWGADAPPTTVEPAAPASTPATQVRGTLYAWDLDGGEQTELGLCTDEGGLGTTACEGLLLSPDGTQVAYADAVGLWVAQVPAGDHRLLAAHIEPGGSPYSRIMLPHAWSPNARWLLARVAHYEGYGLAMIDVRRGTMQDLPDAFCYVGCYIEGSWAGDTLTVATIGISATLYLAQPAEGGKLTVQRLLSPEQVLAYTPRSVYLRPDSRLAFAHFRDAQAPESPAGIYALAVDGSLEEIAPLPEESDYCRDGDCGTPRVLWAPAGSAFLYLDMEADPALLGLPSSSVLWDVRDLLRGAYGFRWGSAR